jgi:hypothetical protein
MDIIFQFSSNFSFFFFLSTQIHSMLFKQCGISPEAIHPSIHPSIHPHKNDKGRYAEADIRSPNAQTGKFVKNREHPPARRRKGKKDIMELSTVRRAGARDARALV